MAETILAVHENVQEMGLCVQLHTCTSIMLSN